MTEFVVELTVDFDEDDPDAEDRDAELQIDGMYLVTVTGLPEDRIEGVEAIILDAFEGEITKVCDGDLEMLVRQRSSHDHDSDFRQTMTFSWADLDSTPAPEA